VLVETSPLSSITEVVIVPLPSNLSQPHELPAPQWLRNHLSSPVRWKRWRSRFRHVFRDSQKCS